MTSPDLTSPPAAPVGLAAVNPYWEAVKGWAARNPVGQMVLEHRYTQEGLDYPAAWDDTAAGGMFIEAHRTRQEMIRRWAWTITAPDTVEFVWAACHGDGGADAVFDPLAGTGYWAHLLARRGLDVAASDLNPRPAFGHPVAERDAVDAVVEHGAGRVLLLSWPPLWDPTGARILDAYRGDWFCYLGEVDGNRGDDRFVSMLARDWRPVSWHRPAQWPGQNDAAVLYRRRRA